MKFEELGLSLELLKSVEEQGYTEATEIQTRAIPILLGADKDFVGVAQTGTGKTAAFVLPLLDKLDDNNKNVQALILSPTRELANQIREEIVKLGRHKKLRSLAVFGGASYTTQINGIKRDKPQIIVGTPGRIMDLMDRGVLKFDKAEFVVLDEADEMLNMGFFEDVQKIIKAFDAQKKMWMFSATMPRPILDLINRDFKNPEIVKITKKSISNDSIDQRHYLVREQSYAEALYRIISSEEEEIYGIIFCRTRMDTKNLAEDLLSRGIRVETLHGELNQSQRDAAMRKFKQKRVQLLVCTDVAARGIDVDSLTHVFNYGLPQDIESYVHRIGRTGRAGLTGVAISLVDPRATHLLRRTEQFVKKEIRLCKLPSVRSLKASIVKEKMAAMTPMIEAISPAPSDPADSGNSPDSDSSSGSNNDPVSDTQLKQSGNAVDASQDTKKPAAKKGKRPLKVDETFDIFAAQFANVSHEDLVKMVFNWNFEKEFSKLDRTGDLNERPRVFNRSRTGGRFDRNERSGGRVDRKNIGRGGDKVGDRGGDRRHQQNPTRPNCTRLFVNVGKDDGIEFMTFIDEMSRVTGLRKQQIQNVSVKSRFSFIDIPSNRCDDVLKVTNAKIKNRRVRFEQTS